MHVRTQLEVGRPPRFHPDEMAARRRPTAAEAARKGAVGAGVVVELGYDDVELRAEYVPWFPGEERDGGCGGLDHRSFV